MRKTTPVTRSLPPALAPLVEDLELDAVVVTSTQDLTARAKRLGLNAPTRAIERLSHLGWLLKTGVAGAWEFAPAAHAGPFGHGDPFIVLRAQLAVTPNLPARLALGSALWRLGIADRAPDRHEVSLPPRAKAPEALRRSFRVIRFAPTLPAEIVAGAPVSGAATTLAHMADSPSAVRSWGAVLDVLPDLVAAADSQQVLDELAGRTMATRVRASYLLQSLAPDLVASIGADPANVVWFGRRGELRRFDNEWNVADTALPRHPSQR